ncbi:hypothetical protein GYA49_05050 [Candidatus Beckwithbacteria bacterium]|nr:hypothetical protein [Candidatus Beckwithbacteria bacterium]
MKNPFYIPSLIAIGFVTRYLLLPLIKQENSWLQAAAMFVVFVLGIYLILQTASMIEKTTAVLKDRTGLAGGLLQSLGTAFPDMVIGVVSAILSLQAVAADPIRAINLAIIAASTTFGSNIYNIFHASWCMWRQNLANSSDKKVLMFPKIIQGGIVTPITHHKNKPPKKQIDDAIFILVLLSMLTTTVALGMVLFGKVSNVPVGITGDLYQLTRPIGFIVLALSIGVLFYFRKSHHETKEKESNEYSSKKTIIIWLNLAIAAIVILLAAESLIEVVSHFSEIAHIPYVVSGVATGLIGCLGEMIVIHNFTVHASGRLADAVIGVAMDNIVTTTGAAFIAILGGIFLGSEALIIIFVLMLFANTTLIQQISKLKNYL